MHSPPVVPTDAASVVWSSSVRDELDFFDLSDFGMILVDATGSLLRVNQAFGRLVGQSSADLVGMEFAVIMGLESDGSDEVAALAFDEHNPQSRVMRKRHLRPDGSVAWIELTMRPIVDDQGAVTSIFAQAIDVTSLKLAEDDVRRFAAAQQIAHLGSFEQDPHSGLLEATAELRRLVGIEANGPMTVDQLMHVVHPEDRDRLGAAIDACFREHAPVDLVHRLLLDDGTLRWVHALAEWTETSQVGRYSVLGTIIDITEREVAEQAVVAMLRELEEVQRVARARQFRTRCRDRAHQTVQRTPSPARDRGGRTDFDGPHHRGHPSRGPWASQ